MTRRIFEMISHGAEAPENVVVEPAFIVQEIDYDFSHGDQVDDATLNKNYPLVTEFRQRYKSKKASFVSGPDNDAVA